jgi:hypothetical protein
MVVMLLFFALGLADDPEPTPFPFLYMRSVNPSTYGYNFDIVGSETASGTEVWTITRVGFFTRFRVADHESVGIQLRPVLNNAVNFTTTITTIGAAAIVEFNAVNLAAFPQNITIAVEVDISVNGFDDAPCYDMGNLDGFRVHGYQAQFRFYCRHHPLVTDVSTYWFGEYASAMRNRYVQTTASQFSGSDSACAFTWQNVTVPGGSSIPLTMVIAGGVGSNPPTLDLSDTTILSTIDWDTPITIAGHADDPENELVTIIAVFDEDPSRAARIAVEIPSGSSFSHSILLTDFAAASRGIHQLDVYAFDHSGMTSPAVSFSFFVNAPTPRPSASPIPTPSASASIFPASTVPLTRTPTPTGSPSPSLSPFPHVTMVLRNPNETGTSFALDGWLDSPSATPIAPVASGWNVFCQIGSQSSFLWRMEDTSLAGVVFGIVVHVFGPAAIVSATAFNSNSADTAVNICIEADVRLLGNDGAPVYTLDKWGGFDIRHGAAHFTVFCRDHSMVVNTDTYWYGSWYIREQNFWAMTDQTETHFSDTACALSWQNRVIPPRGKRTFSVIMSWFADSTPPNLDMSETVIPAIVDSQDRLTFSGLISDAEDQRISVFAVIDSDYSYLPPVILNQTSGRAFSVTLNVASDLRIPGGHHEIAVYAIDSSGTVSRNAPRFPIEVIAPPETNPPTAPPSPTRLPPTTPPVTRSPFPTRSRTASPLPSPTPYAYLIMEETAAGYQQNFALIGRRDDGSGAWIGFTNSGVHNLVLDRLGQSDLLAKAPTTTLAGLRVETILTLAGALVLVTFNVSNPLPTAENVSIGCTIDLMVNANDAAPCVDTDGHRGFSAFGDFARVNFHLKEWPLVTDVDTYWFGAFANRSANTWLDSDTPTFGGVDTACAWSWKDREVPAGGRIALSCAISWGVGSDLPILAVEAPLLTDPVNWATTFSVTGSATDPEGRGMTIIAVPDADMGRHRVLGTVQSHESFSYALTFSEFGVRNGEHVLDIYAIDITGMISPAARFLTHVVAPTVPASRTPPKSPLATGPGDPTRTRSPPTTRTPYATAPPLRTPPGDLRMVVTADVDPHTNFRLQAEGPSLGGDIIHISTTGFNSRYQLSTGSTGRLVRLQPVTVDQVAIQTRVTPIGGSAVVAFEVVNLGNAAVAVNLSFDTDVNLDENDDAPILKLNDVIGFRCEGGLLHFRVFTGNYPLVVNSDTYWFGSFFELEDNIWSQTSLIFLAGEDSAFAVSWQDRVVLPGERIVLSSVMTWYGEGAPPTLNMATTNLPASIDWQSPLTLSGSVSQQNGYDMHLVLVINNDFGWIHRLGSDLRSGTSFSYSHTPAELGLGRGSHSFDIYAFDAHGSVSTAVNFVIDVQAPTMQPTSTRRRSGTRTMTFHINTPNPTLDPDPGDSGAQGAGGLAGDRNSGAKVAMGVMIAVGVAIFVVVGFLLWRDRRGRANRSPLDSAGTYNEVGAYTI